MEQYKIDEYDGEYKIHYLSPDKAIKKAIREGNLEEVERLVNKYNLKICPHISGLSTTAFILTDKLNSVEPFGSGGHKWGNSNISTREICLQKGAEPAMFYHTKESAELGLKKMPHSCFYVLEIKIEEINRWKY